MKTQVASALALTRIEGIGPVLFKRLVAAFGDPIRPFGAPAEALARIEGISPNGAVTLARRLEAQPEWPEIEREIERALDAGVEILHLGGEGYPPLLATLSDPPPILYRRGAYHEEDALALAIVGTRRPTPYGRAQAKEIAAELARTGITVISGLALGIDGEAHQGALDSGGRTIAVLGSGLDCPYPPEHRELSQRIAEQGALFSETPLGAPPEARNFPRRNRIISGLSLGVLVIEAGERSGSLITARNALDQGREVYALPGNVTSPYSRGTNRLIRQGARLVETAADLLEDIAPMLGGSRASFDAPPNLEPTVVQRALPLLDEREQSLWSRLTQEPLHLDRLGELEGKKPSEIAHTLLQLEMKGLAQPMGGGYYIRAG